MNAIDFKDEAAVKEYLDRIGIEFRFQCFSEEKSDGCHRLGDWLEFVKKDYKRAARVYKSTCDIHHNAHSCFKYGNYATLGKGLEEKNSKEAAEYYRKGCDAAQPHPSACANLAAMLKEEELATKSPPLESRKYFEKGCSLDDGSSCLQASNSYLKEGEYRDFKKAFQFATKGCDLGDYMSCGNLGLMYTRGDGVEADQETGEMLQKKAKAMRSELTEDRTNITFGQ